MTVAFALAFAALILLCVGFILWFARHTAEQSADTLLQAAAGRIQSERFTPAQIADPAEWQDIKEDLAPQNLALVVVNDQGHMLQRTVGAIPTWPHPAPQNWRFRTVPLEGGTAVLGMFWQKTERTLQIQAATLIILSLLLLSSATFGAWFLVGRTLSPIYHLSRQADAASIDNLRIRLNAPSEDEEITHLVRTLNGLLERLSEAMAARGRFYAAASHELRTPLQTLTGYLEVALLQKRDAEEYRSILEEASTQAGRLTSLIQALLLLNQVEVASAPQCETLDLAEVCDRWITYFQPLGASRRLCVEARLPDTMPLKAASSYVDMLLRNLLENAFKYTTPGSGVRVRLERTEQGTHLTIFNECPSLPKGEEARLFEPFYRPDTSRTAETGGNGLGLAICKAVAHAGGWCISLAQKAGGIEVQVLFPP